MQFQEEAVVAVDHMYRLVMQVQELLDREAMEEMGIMDLLFRVVAVAEERKSVILMEQDTVEMARHIV